MAKRLPNLASHIETVLLVTVITVIVWIIAEGANLAPGTTKFMVQLSGVGAVAIEPDNIEVTVDYKCPTSRIEEFRGFAAEGITVDITPDESNPIQVIDLVSRLNDHPRLRDLNVSVSRVDPPRATVHAEPIKTYEAEVHVNAEGLDLTGEAKVLTPKVTVLTTPSAWKAVRENLKLEAKLAGVQGLDTATKGVPLTREVPVTMPSELATLGATVNPSRVDVTFTIRNQTAVYKMPSVPLLIRLPAIEGNKYEVIPENNAQFFTEGVELTGPRELIGKIEKDEIKVYAVLRVTNEDILKADKGVQNKALFFDVPPGVIASPHLLNFTIVKRPAPATTATP